MQVTDDDSDYDESSMLPRPTACQFGRAHRRARLTRSPRLRSAPSRKTQPGGHFSSEPCIGIDVRRTQSCWAESSFRPKIDGRSILCHKGVLRLDERSSSSACEIQVLMSRSIPSRCVLSSERAMVHHSTSHHVRSRSQCCATTGRG